MRPMFEMAGVIVFHSYLDAQREFGTPAAYEASLTDQVNWLSARAKEPTDMWPANAIAFDKALTYARLSESQAQRGATQDSARSLESAAALCPQLRWKECSGAKILAFTQTLDKRLADHCAGKGAAGEPSGR